jgi:hypothetical protein
MIKILSTSVFLSLSLLPLGVACWVSIQQKLNPEHLCSVLQVLCVFVLDSRIEWRLRTVSWQSPLHSLYSLERELSLYGSCSVAVTAYIWGVDKIMETLRNWGIEFVLATLKELQLATLNVLPFVYTLAHISVLVIVLNDSLCERIGK